MVRCRIRELFDVKKVTVDGKEYDGISIELTITRSGKEDKVRYNFYSDNGVWKLYEIETLQTVVR